MNKKWMGVLLAAGLLGTSGTVQTIASETVSVSAEDAAIIEKYPELFEYLKNDDLGSAEAYIRGLREEQDKDLGELEEYLVTVEINNDNFLDYFEPVIVPYKDAFDELVFMSVGVRSKMYDEDLIIYEHDNISYEMDVDGMRVVQNLTEGLMIWHAIGSDESMTGQNCTFKRVIPGKVTFVKGDYIDHKESHEFERLGWLKEEIWLKNGEQFWHTGNKDYPY